MLGVRQRNQLLADMSAVAQAEIAHAAHLVGRFAVLDVGFGHRGMPAVMAVEVAQHFPDALDRRVDDGGARHALHGLTGARNSS